MNTNPNADSKSVSETHPNPLVEKYLRSLSAMELKAYNIAKSHLGTTFNIEKANAFLRWKRENAEER